MKPIEPHRSPPGHALKLGCWPIWLFGGAVATLAVVLLAVSASMHGWEYKKKLVGDYALLAVDVREQMSISRMLPNGDAIGVIDETVFAVGWNNDFVIAQQHAPAVGTQTKSSATNFYILRVSDGEVWGPLTAAQFHAERAKQAVPHDLNFTLVFQDLK